MKKTVAKVLACAACFGACFGLAGCDEDVDMGYQEVTKKEWKSKLSIDFDAATNYTAQSEGGSTYKKSEAMRYGDWSRYSTITKYDKTAQILHVQSVDERYVPETSSVSASTSVRVPAHFDTDTNNVYYFYNGGKYYRVTDENYDYESAQKSYLEAIEEREYSGTFENYCDLKNYDKSAQYAWKADELTAAQFINYTELSANMTSVFSLLSTYAELYEMFDYDEDTGRYKMASFGTMSIEIGFFGTNGIEMYEALTSITYSSDKFYDVGKTTVTVPAEARKAILYIDEE